MPSVLIRLSLIGFVTALSARCVDPIIPQIALGLPADPGAVALLSTAFALPFALAQPVLGPLADMAGKIRLMIACLIVLSLASIVCGMANDYAILFVARVVAGIATGGIFPVGLAIIGDLVPVRERQIAIGRWLTVIMTGNLLGASVAGVINDALGWRAVFLVIGGAGLFVFALAILTLRQAAREHTPAYDFAGVPGRYRAILSNPRAKICYGAVLFEAIAIFGLFPFVALFLLEAGETRALIAGLVIGGFSLGGVVYSLSVSLMLRFLTPRAMMQTGGIISALMLCAIALEPSWPIQFAVFTVLGHAFFMLHGSIQVQVTELAPTIRGAATSLHSSFFFIGQAAGPVLFGLGLATVGARISIAIGAVIMLIVGTVCARLLGAATSQRPI